MNITRQIYLIGIGMGSRNTRTLLTESILEQCDCIIGASRMLESVQEYKKPQFCSYKPDEICQWLDTHLQYQNIGIVLSGDTGCYSGAKKLENVIKTKLGNDEQCIQVYQIPGI